MSHAVGAIRFPDGLIKFFEYNGTVDVCQPRLFDTQEELRANWRKQEWNVCKCQDTELVEIASTYGYGFWWFGRACRKHNCITDGFEPLDTNRGLPDWFPNKKMYEW